VDEEKIKHIVREEYGKVARKRSTRNTRNAPSMSCCGPNPSQAKGQSFDDIQGDTSCCGGSPKPSLESQAIGYSVNDIQAVPEGSNLGLGCGNPLGLASVREGDVVLDLGSGGGFDCFLATKKVGPTGKVIGVDMTPEMIEKARHNAQKGHYENVEFRLGEIEHLPAADNSVDLVISNCVVNLVPNKVQVFRDVHRVLKPGGRVMISDLVLTRELPESIKESAAMYASCVAGATLKDQYLNAMKQAGLQDVVVQKEVFVPVEFLLGKQFTEGVPRELIEQYSNAVLDITVSATKPNRRI